MVNLKRAVCLVMAVCVMVAGVGCSKAEVKDYKAKVNDDIITNEQYQKEVDNYKSMAEANYGADAWETEVKDGKTLGQMYEELILDNMVLELVLRQSAEKDGITATDEEINKELESFKTYYQLADDAAYKTYLETNKLTEESLKDTFEKQLIINSFINKKMETVKPTEDELKKLFETTKPEKQVKASHILVDTEQEAKDAIKRIEKGEKFEDVAKEISKDGSAASGGDLGFFPYGQMVEEFSKAAFGMKVNEITSNPVKTEHGYHVIKVTDIKETYDDFKSQMEEQYKSNKYNEFITELEKNAKIDKK